jgi:asparagine synthase (glutamine-hydrolysing)
MNGGVLALIDLGGGPVNPADAAALGLSASERGFVFKFADKGRQDDRVLQDDERCTILTGHIGDLAEIAQALGAAENLRPVELARLALDRWSEEAAARLPGEWVILDWQRGATTIIQSAARRVRTFYARRGNCIAIAPDVFGLSRLSWIGRQLDEEGLLAVLTRGAQPVTRSVLAGVSELDLAECVRFTTTGTTAEVKLPFVEMPRSQRSFSEAIEEASELLGRIVEERLAQHGDVACLLSGGLDSSLLTMFVADRLRTGQRAICLTSVAPPESAIADEYAQARSVAVRLGLDHVPVAPGPVPGIYAPDPGAFTESNGPSLSVRHYLYKALNDQALALGVTGLFDGCFGERTVTGLMALDSWRWRFRENAKRLLGRGQSAGMSPFRVRLAPHRLAAQPAANAAAKFKPLGHPVARLRHEAWGYFPNVTNIMRSPAIVSDAPIIEYAFRDQRLLQLFAGFPAHFVERDGYNRAPARAMMAGRIPDAVRLRRDVMPFSPDYTLRLQNEAPSAQARVAAFRKADIDDWLDLDWLDGALGRFASHGPRDIPDAFEVQLTAMAAEFLVWWRYGGL